MCAAFRSHRKSATSSGSRSRPSARQFNRDVLTLDEAATPYERGPHCASQQIKLRNVPFGAFASIGRRTRVRLAPDFGHVRSPSHSSRCANSGSMRRSKTALPFDQLVRADEHSPIGLYGISTADRPHSALMLRARITLPHFSVSSAMNFPNAADVIDIGL